MPNENHKPVIPMIGFIAQNVEAGNYQLVDIAGERDKDKLMSVEEFAERISRYTLRDYLHTDKPYNDLLECSRAQPGLFEQFAAVLMDSAKAQMNARDNTPYEEYVARQIAVIRDAFLPDLTEATSILDFINIVESDPETADKVSVLPLMCGSGKSTAITLKIKEVIEHGEGLGMLLVTDSKKRLDEIWNKDTTNPLLGEEVREFIKAHQNDVTIMTGDTYSKAIQAEKKSPVLAMTTQRYFNILTKEEILHFLTWKDGGTRSLILFDEEPYLNEVLDLTPKSVNDIDTMLRMVLDEETIGREDKQWCVRQWEVFREKFLGRLWEYEYDHEGEMFYHEEAEHSLTEDDDRFFHVINKCRTDIRSDNIDNFKNLYALKAFADGWSIYTHRTAGAYESKFTVFLDNSDKVKGLEAKVIVLDGTGDISPTYVGQDYIDMRGGQGFVRSLSHLTVTVGDIDTSKASMLARGNSIPQTVTAFLNSEGYNQDNAYIFTYKDRESKFTRFGGRTAHFGGIKGLNEYAEAACIAQVGLNEMQPVHYLVHMLARGEEMRSKLIGLSPEESNEQIRNIMTETDNCAHVKVAHILADIDQNMFRSAIRSAKNRQDVVFYLFYKHTHIPQLLDVIIGRYCDFLGGNHSIVREEEIRAFQPPVKETKAEIIYRWYCEWDERPIKRAEIIAQLELLGVGYETFKKELGRGRIKQLFEGARRKAQENGYPNGWYMK